MRSQKLHLQQETSDEVLKELSEVRRKLAELAEKLEKIVQKTPN